MLQLFFENTLNLNKKDKRELEYLLFKYFWENEEIYVFLSKHAKYYTFSQGKRIEEKIKEIGEILNEKS